MKKLLYTLKVILISTEAALLLSAALMFIFAKPYIILASQSLSINEELEKFIILAPIGISGWLLNELRQIVFEDEKSAKLLVTWPSYWKLKAHISVSLLYCGLFTLLAIIPWLTQKGTKTDLGFTLFTTGLTGLLIVASSVYTARFTIKEKLASANL